MGRRSRFALLVTILAATSAGAAHAVRSTDTLTISAPADMTVEATEQCGQTFCGRVSYSFTASGGTPPYRFVCNLDSGSLLTVGSHRIGCIASDSRGNSTPEASFTATVTGGGTPAPPPPPPASLSISAPADMTVQATTPCNQTTCAQVFYSFSASGGYPPYRFVCNLDSPAFLPVGAHSISCIASDSAGNSTPEAHFTATVTAAPAAPATTTTTATTTSATTTTTAAPAGSVGATAANAPAATSGSTAAAPEAAPGGTPAAAPSAAPESRDVQAPAIAKLSALTVAATSRTGAVAQFVAIATDPDSRGADVSVSCAPQSGSTFHLGPNGTSRTTTVMCTAHDAAGHAAAPRSFTVTVLGADAQLAGLARDVRAADRHGSGALNRLQDDLARAGMAAARGDRNAARRAVRSFASGLRALPVSAQRRAWANVATRIANVLAGG